MGARCAMGAPAANHARVLDSNVLAGDDRSVRAWSECSTHVTIEGMPRGAVFLVAGPTGRLCRPCSACCATGSVFLVAGPAGRPFDRLRATLLRMLRDRLGRYRRRPMLCVVLI